MRKIEMKTLYFAINNLLEENSSDIHFILDKLQDYFRIVVFSREEESIDYKKKLLDHGITYDKIEWNVSNILGYLQRQQNEGYIVSGIVMNNEKWIRKLLPYYGNKIWTTIPNVPNTENYKSPYEWIHLYLD